MAEPRLSGYGRASLGCEASDFLCSWIAGRLFSCRMAL